MTARSHRGRAARGPRGRRAPGTRPARRRSPGVDPDQPIAPAGPCPRRGRGALSGSTSTRSGEAASSSGSVSGSRWSECLWLARTRSTAVRSAPRSGARVIRTWGRAVPSYFRVRCSERYGIDRPAVPPRLDQEAALPQPPDRQRARAGCVSRISSISSGPWRTGSIMARLGADASIRSREPELRR